MVSRRLLQALFFTAVFALVPICVQAQSAQGKPGAPATDAGLGQYIIRTENGYLIVHNREKNSYLLEFKGTKFEPEEGDHPVFTIDDKLVQIVAVSKNNYWTPKAKVKKEPSDDELLEAHKIWERDYLAGELKAKLSVTSEIFSIERSRKVMYWSFPMPKELGADFSHQIFLTTLVGTDIIGLNASPTSAGEQKAYRDYLIESMNTLKISSKPFNIKELEVLYKKGDLAD